jgi:uncharacterized repeat protein (TIGR02543 family)
MPGADVTLSAEYGEPQTSADASLSSITVYSGGDEAAQCSVTTGQTEYTLTVPNKAETVKILAETSDIQAVPSLDGGREFLEDVYLDEGRNNFEITVASSDGKTLKKYTLIIKRAPDLSLSEFKITGVDDPLYVKELKTDTTAPQAVTVIKHDVGITAALSNPNAAAVIESGDDSDGETAVDEISSPKRYQKQIYVAELRYEKNTVIVSARLGGEEYTQEYIVNVCYSENEDDVGTGHNVDLMYNYAGAPKNGVYRRIIVPITGRNGEGDPATLREGLEESGADIQREFYEFEGWYTSASGGARFDPAIPANAAMQLYAHWKAIEYTLRFEYNYPANDPYPQTDPSPVEITGSRETELVPPNDPKHPHYDFAGWRAGNAPYEPTQYVTETRTVYAHWTGKKYKITFKAADADTLTEQIDEVIYPATVETPADSPVRAGYGFAGWYSEPDGAKFAPYVPVPSDNEAANKKDFYARWEEGVMTLALSSNYSGGGVVYKNPKYGDPVSLTASEAPSRARYKFAGWYSDPYDGSLFGSADGNVSIGSYTGTPAVLYAHWTADKYTLTLNYNGGSGGDTSIVSEYPNDVVLPVPIKEGYVFAGWCADSNLTGSAAASVLNAYAGSPAALYAKWDVKTYTVAFYNNYAAGDNTTLYTATVPASSLVKLQTTPVRRGYVAKGWYAARAGGSKFRDDQMITGNTNFYIQWIHYTDESSITSNAIGGDIIGNYVETDTGFDEVHTYMSFDLPETKILKFTARPASLYGQVLVVGGGGGGGGSGTHDNGGGGGAGGIQYARSTAMPPVGVEVPVTLGYGGGYGGANSNGAPGNPSSFGSVTAAGGGYGGAGERSDTGRGGDGGSGGGGGAGSGNKTWGGGSPTYGSYNSSYSYPSLSAYDNDFVRYGNSGYGSDSDNSAGRGGGAGGNGEGLLLDIGGFSPYTYASGGYPGQSGAAYFIYGNGGKGASAGSGNNANGNGIQGTVIVRFPYTYMGD